MPFRLPAHTPRRDAPHRVAHAEVLAWALDEDAVDRARRDPARLRLVASLGLIAPGIDEPLDQLVRLARELLHAPAAFLGVSGGEEDFYKSLDGAGEPLASERRLAGRTFCHYALAAGRTLALADTLGLGRPWSEVHTVHSLGVRAYLGSPVRIDGMVVGTLCVIDLSPREWTDREVDILDTLAASYQRELEHRATLAAWREPAEEPADLTEHGERLVASLAQELRTPQVVTPPPLPGGATLDRRAAAPVRVRDLLEQVFQLFEPVAARNGVLLQVGDVCEAAVMVDHAQGLRALGKVLANALKITPDGRRVTLQAVRVSAPVGRARAGRWVALTVTDEGVGMGEDEIGRCTQRSWRGRAGLAQGVGDGLGLAMVREFVERHGGKLRLESRAGEGTRVSLALPEAQATDPTPTNPLHRPGGADGPDGPPR